MKTAIKDFKKTKRYGIKQVLTYYLTREEYEKFKNEFGLLKKEIEK